MAPVRPVATPVPPEPVGRAWPWRALIVVALVLAVLALAGVVADNRLRAVAEDRIATRITQTLRLSEPPEVEIDGGWPFTGQLLTRHYPQIRVDDTDLSLGSGEGSVTVASAHADLRDVTMAADGTEVSIGSLEAAIVVGYPEAARLSGRDLSWQGADPEGRGRIQVSETRSFLGRPIRLSLSGRPVLGEDRRSLVLAESTLSVAGIKVPAWLTRELLGQVSAPLPLSALPPGIEASTAEAAESGLSFRLTGADVRLGG